MFTTPATRRPSLFAKVLMGNSQAWQILFAAAFLSSHALGAPSDGQLLLTFKDSLANGATVLTGWNTSQPCEGSTSNWSGITCNSQGQVTTVDLQFAGLQGSLPVPMLPSTLENLFLSGNSLSGSIPDEWSQLSSLRVLWLDNNQFVGGIPDHLPASLQELALGFNQLDAPLASNWSQLPALKILSAESNSLQGPLPAHLPDSLQQLLLSENSVSGTVPSGSLPSSLQLLYLGGNQLTGSLPASLPASLSELYLGRNQLRSPLPHNWSLPASLSSMDVGGCLVDTDMDAVGTLQLPTGFQTLWLNNNNITGTLSSAWALPSTMQKLDLSNNELTGSLPPDWSLPVGLDLSLTNNSLSGPLPNESSWVNVKITVAPGNEGICGQVPSTPEYQVALSRVNAGQLENNLPACPPGMVSPSPPPVAAPPSSGGGGSSSAATIGGAVGGAVGGLVLICLAGWVYFRRRKRRLQVQHKPQGPDNQGLDGKDSLDYDPEATLGTNSYSIKGLKTSPTSVLRPDPPVPSALMASDALLCSIVSQLTTLASVDSSQSAISASTGRASSRTSQHTNVDMEYWNVPFEDLKLTQKVGEGSFGKVYLASWKTTQVAVKLLAGSEAMMKSDPSEAASLVLSANNPVLVTLRAECSKMAALRHPNVLGFLAICSHPPCVVSEYCERGSLHDILHAARTSPELYKELSWDRRLKMAADAAAGMAYLHTRNPPLVHRDLKSPNLLVTEHWVVKIADFNLSKFMEEPGSAVASSFPAVTNPRWLAPEVLSGQKPTLASDVFSFGVVLWEMLTWATPWDTITNPWAVSGLVTEGKRLQVPEFSKLPGDGRTFVGLTAYLDLMHKCWAQAPEDRPTFNEVLDQLRDLYDQALAEDVYKEETGGTSASQPASDLASGIREWLSPIITKDTNLSGKLSGNLSGEAVPTTSERTGGS